MKGLDCVTTKYTYHPDEWWYRLFWLVSVNNGRYNLDTGKLYNWWFLGDLSKWLDWTLGSARCDADGNCNVKVFFSEGNYQVIDTDYDNYSIVYGCDDYFGIYYTETSWLLTRERYPDPAIIEQAKAIMKDKIPHYPVDTKWSAGGITYQGD